MINALFLLIALFIGILLGQTLERYILTNYLKITVSSEYRVPIYIANEYYYIVPEKEYIKLKLSKED